MNAMKKSVMIIGAGLNQINLIKSAKEIGYCTVVIDPLHDAPGKELSDFFYVIDPIDFEKHCEIVEKHKISGIVTTQMDKPLQFMAKIAKKYGFSFPDEESILWARNKYLMKMRFIKFNVPCAKGIIIKNKLELESISPELLIFPLIIKPVDAYSSRGVFKIESFEELENKFEITKNFSSDSSVLIEEFIGGRMISVEGFVFEKNPRAIQYTERYKFTDFPYCVELGHIQPAVLSDKEKSQVNKVLFKAIKSLKLDDCGFHAELKLNESGIYLIEIAARLGGDFNASHLVPISTGINIEKIIAQIAMNEKPVIPDSIEQYSMIKWIEFPVGKKVKKIRKIELDKDLSVNIVTFNVLLKENDLIPQVTDSAKRRGYIIAKGSSRDEIIITCKKVEDFILQSIEYY